MSKPEAFSETTASDFFHFIFFGLPSKILELPNYDIGVANIRQKLLELVPQEYSKKVPADGFAYYARSLWEAVLKCADLDIPSQKEQLAIHRY